MAHAASICLSHAPPSMLTLHPSLSHAPPSMLTLHPSHMLTLPPPPLAAAKSEAAKRIKAVTQAAQAQAEAKAAAKSAVAAQV